MTPFYILFDLDLNANHYRLYGQIEQMESNPDPDVNPRFSYKWMAAQLGINERNTKACAAVLKDKGYIEHIKTKEGWLWRIAKKPVMITEDTESKSSNSVAQRHPPVSPSDTPNSVAQRHPKSFEVKVPEVEPVLKNAGVREDLISATVAAGQGLALVTSPKASSSYQETYFMQPQEVAGGLLVDDQDVAAALVSVQNSGYLVTQDDIDRAMVWWEMYPRKTNMIGWLLSWFSQGCNLRAAELTEKLREQVKHEKNYQGMGNEFTMHPMTYISGRRWRDQVVKAKKSHYDNKDTSWMDKKDIFDD